MLEHRKMIVNVMLIYFDSAHTSEPLMRLWAHDPSSLAALCGCFAGIMQEPEPSDQALQAVCWKTKVCRGTLRRLVAMLLVHGWADVDPHATRPAMVPGCGQWWSWSEPGHAASARMLPGNGPQLRAMVVLERAGPCCFGV